VERGSDSTAIVAITFSVVAGIMSGPRASSAVLTRRGLGVISRSPRSGSVNRGGTLRPNRVWAMPIAGDDRSLYDPSTVRAMSARGSGSGSSLGRDVSSSVS